ncbi:autotransporter outer membrane beta-barrel domain-containing protein [Stenotrophomonas indicatrix]
MVGVAGEGKVDITAGGTLSSAQATIGKDVGSKGGVWIGDAGSTWTNSKSLIVGDHGSGTLNISSGARVSAGTFMLGNYETSDGTLTVDGQGTILETGLFGVGGGTNNSTADVNGKGAMYVYGGGTVKTSGSAIIGQIQNSQGDVYITTGGLWEIDKTLYVGSDSNGSVLVTAGGLLKSGEASCIACSSNANASVQISGSGSTWTEADHIEVGFFGNGALTIDDGARVSSGTPEDGYLLLSGVAGSTGVLNMGVGGLSGTLETAEVRGREGDARVNFNHGDFSEFKPRLTGSLNVSKIGSGSTLLFGRNDYTGETRVEGGTWAAGIEGAFSASSNHFIDAGGQLDLMGLNQNIGALNNSGVVSFPSWQGGAGTQLTVNGDYYGGGGLLLMNVALGADNSLADRLVVNGDTNGVTNIQVRNAGGSGSATEQGIQLVDVGGASAGVFKLQGRAVAGLYEYRLYQGGRDTPNDGGWYLRSQADPVDPVDPVGPLVPPSPPDGGEPQVPVSPTTPLLRPEPAAYLGNQLAALRMFQGTMHDRVGEQALDSRPGSIGTYGSWVRVQSRNLNSGAIGEQIGVKTNADVVQLGAERRFDVGASRVHAGVMAGYGHANTRGTSQVSQLQAQGKVSGKSIGLYSTWFQRQTTQPGAYIDVSVRYDRYDNQVNGDALGRERYDSRVFSGSIESGYALQITASDLNKVYIEPQVQVVYSDFRSDDVVETSGTHVRLGRGDGLTTRVGARLYGRELSGMRNRVQPFVAINWWSGGDDLAVAMDGQSLGGSLPKNIFESKVGAQLELGPGWSAWGQFAHQQGSRKYRDFNGQLGLKFSW